jgi:hypothetical protein
MFDFLNKLFDWMFQFVPQFIIISPSQEGIRVTCIPWMKKSIKVKKFGWYAYWPLVQEFYTGVIKPQITTVELSRISNKGSCVETIWAVQYWIQNIEKAQFAVENWEEMLVSHSAKVIGRHVASGSEADISGILKEIKESVGGIGLYVQQVFPLQHVIVRPHKLFLDNIAEKAGRVVGS